MSLTLLPGEGDVLTYKDLTKVIMDPAVLNAYRVFLSVRDDEYPDMNYFGVNFKGGEIVSIKFYFAVYKRLPKKAVALFLPDVSHFSRYYPLWEPTRYRSIEHTGCTFTVKFKGNTEPIYGFHYRLPPTDEAYDLVGEAESLPFQARELGTRPGINYEYSKNCILRRRYYYFENAQQKAYIAERFCKPFAANSTMCEMTEFPGGAKVNIWRFDFKDDNLSRPQPFCEKEVAIIDRIKKDFGFINISDGCYEGDGVVATYFFNIDGSNKNDPFPEKANFHVDTLGALLEKVGYVFE